MKVVKKPEEWKGRQVTCDPSGGCGAVLEVDFADLCATRHPGNGDQREPDWTEVYVTCPECSRRIPIRDVPTWQQERILRRGASEQWMGR